MTISLRAIALCLGITLLAGALGGIFAIVMDADHTDNETARTTHIPATMLLWGITALNASYMVVKYALPWNVARKAARRAAKEVST